MTADLAPRVLNSALVDTDHGERWIDLVRGNLAGMTADVLVASTHANPAKRPAGAVIAALERRFGTTIDASTLESVVTPPHLIGGVTRVGTFGTHRVRWGDTKRVLLLVRTPDAGRVSDPAHTYQTAVWTLFTALAGLELAAGPEAPTSVALAFLAGSAERGYDPATQVGALLSAAERWLQLSRATRRVSLCVYEHDDAALFDAAFDAVMQRPRIEETRSSVIDALCSQIVSLTSHRVCSAQALQGGLFADLRLALTSEPIAVRQLALQGRLLAEHIVTDLFRRSTQQPSGQRNLWADIENLPLAAPWVKQYLHVLRTLGNDAVHFKQAVDYQPANVDAQDLLPLLVAVERALGCWIDRVDPQLA